jgi:hypothetical protein
MQGCGSAHDEVLLVTLDKHFPLLHDFPEQTHSVALSWCA